MTILIRWLHQRFAARRAADPTAEPPPWQPHLLRTSRPGQVGALALVSHQARFDLLGFLRNGQARFFTLVLPILFLVILVTVFGNDEIGPQHIRSATYIVPGIAAMGIIAASFVNLVMSIVGERESGVLKRRRATPVPAWVLVAGRTLTAMAVSLAVMAVLLLIGSLAYGVDVPLSSLSATAITGLFGSAVFAVLGYAVASLIGSADAAQPMVQSVILPLYFISGVLSPT